MTSKVAAVDATGRDQLMKDVMVEAGKLKGRLMDICVNSHPQNVAFIDWVIVVSVLSKVGIVDLHVYDDDDDYGYDYDYDYDYCDLADHNSLHYEVDDDGRITTLRIGAEIGTDPFDLPAGIARLERLTDLMLWNCRSLPANEDLMLWNELSNLPYLQSLCLFRCSDLLENFPLEMELNHLKKLWVSESRFRSSSPFLAWMTKQLPNLEALHFCDMGKNVMIVIMDVLQNFDVCFQDNLKELTMTYFNLDDNDFGTLLFEILPRFPNMNRLDLGWNQIESVQSIVDRLKSDKTCFVSKWIRRLRLYQNPVMNSMKEDPKEKTTILSFLQTFNTIFNLEGSLDEDHYDPDIEYALRINHAGRNIVEGSGDRPLPLSVWPVVLARSFEKSDRIYDSWHKREQKNPTGLYYLLHNGPALTGRVGLVSDDSGRLLSSNDDGNAKENPSKKNCKIEESKGDVVAC